ncbi:hypothetical protein BDR07DRAFT_567720 [Suillus spraguei]|nr:hypothetical protein BDR07DRAFT_567720 [Suillus spraguei]
MRFWNSVHSHMSSTMVSRYPQVTSQANLTTTRCYLANLVKPDSFEVTIANHHDGKNSLFQRNELMSTSRRTKPSFNFHTWSPPPHLQSPSPTHLSTLPPGECMSYSCAAVIHLRRAFVWVGFLTSRFMLVGTASRGEEADCTEPSIQRQ